MRQELVRRKIIILLMTVAIVLAIVILLLTNLLHRKAEEETPVMLYEPDLLAYMADFLPEDNKTAFLQQIEEEVQNKRAVDNDRLLALYLDYVQANEDCGIRQESMAILSAEGNTYVMSGDDNTPADYTIQSQCGRFSGYFIKDMDSVFAAGSTVSFLEKGNQLLLALAQTGTEFVMEKSWVVANDDSMRVLYRGREFELAKGNLEYTGYEDVADITLEKGSVKRAQPYQTKIHGKLLSIKREEDSTYRIELEQTEIFPGEADLQVYDLCTGEKDMSASDLTVGYDFTDFVLDEGGCCVAALIARKEKMDTIRVLVKTDGFEASYHDRVVLRSETDCDVITKDETIELAAGEELVITSESDLTDKGRIKLVPKAYTGRIGVTSLTRSQGTPSYRGTLEIEKTGDGFVIVNELPLEEYLYSVVPSEMPVSYPIEALKAQAVSARTYAYAHMQHSTMQKYGAHVDDSAAFQVYNNINESEATTRAVRETEGNILTRQDDIVTTYFYSTSCGYGTDMTAWSCRETVDEKDRYLAAQKIAREDVLECLAQGGDNAQTAGNDTDDVQDTQTAGNDTDDVQDTQIEGNGTDDVQDAQTAENPADDVRDIQTAENHDGDAQAGGDAASMKDADAFAAFIKSPAQDCFESDFAYFRWKYRTDFDEALFWENLEKRYAAAKEQVLTETDAGYQSLPIADSGKVKEIEITRRTEGGAAIELTVIGEHHTYKILTEKNIRYIMANSSTDLKLRADYSQDGSANGMLPSAFIVVENAYDEDEGCIAGYTVYGGGFGHGIGMSQNGASAMAQGGFSYQDILAFFYRDTTLQNFESR